MGMSAKKARRKAQLLREDIAQTGGLNLTHLPITQGDAACWLETYANAMESGKSEEEACKYATELILRIKHFPVFS
jgi:hypothetical protein